MKHMLWTYIHELIDTEIFSRKNEQLLHVVTLDETKTSIILGGKPMERCFYKNDFFKTCHWRKVQSYFYLFQNFCDTRRPGDRSGEGRRTLWHVTENRKWGLWGMDMNRRQRHVTLAFLNIDRRHGDPPVKGPCLGRVERVVVFGECQVNGICNFPKCRENFGVPATFAGAAKRQFSPSKIDR